MEIFSKTSDYELFISSKKLKQLLLEIASGADEVNNTKNPFSGETDFEKNKAVLNRKISKIGFKKYTVELKESGRQPWCRINVSPTPIAIGVELIFIFLAIGAYSGLPLPPIIIPISIILPYFHFISYAKDIQRIGLMLDPIYFNSPIHQSKISGGLLSTVNNFLIPYYILCIVSIIGYLVFAYINLFTF